MSNLNSFAPLNYDIDIDVPIVKATSNPLRKYKKKLRNLEHRQKKQNTREICDAIKSLKKRIYRLENPNKHLPIKKKRKKKKLQRKKIKEEVNDIQLAFNNLPIHARNEIYRNYAYKKALVENYKKIIKSDYKETMLHLKYKRLNK
tara:strand:+ start:354 stop:791 length:438 start_codon:yes stop_codon:yes gene_type:complete